VVPPEFSQYVTKQRRQLGRIAGVHATSIAVVAQHIVRNLEARGQLTLVFGCTHNSRRSILSEVWAHVALAGVHPRLRALSAGSDPQGVAPGTLGALARAGFTISADEQRGWVATAGDLRLALRSKRFADLELSDVGFGLVVNCSVLDESCPTVPGSFFRTPLIFDDPRAADGTLSADAAYDRCCAEIARTQFALADEVRAGLRR
jgi:protein-tyrosine-phosphatase